MRDGQRMVVAAVDAAARNLGLHPGMALTQARALVPGLMIMPATPEEDAAGLQRLAGWCLRYAPLVAPDPPDGLWLETTGCDHLFGGEAELLQDLLKRLNAAGFAARAAVADTPGAAWAIARHVPEPLAITPPNAAEQAIAPLPVSGLRLETDAIENLARLGIERIGQLALLPRAALARRFPSTLLRRLDEALGRVPEPISPILPPSVIASRLGFVEPLLTAESLAFVIEQLAARVCQKLDRAGLGARQLDLLLTRVDGSVQAVRIGAARPSHDAVHIARLLKERLETVDAGLGVEAMRLVVSLADRVTGEQSDILAGEHRADLSVLIDRLANRLGAGRVWRAASVESDVPERSVRRIPALAQPSETEWPEALPRPVRLLSPPQPVEALALLPDRPPATFTWRRRRFRVRRADGPERIHGEWWRDAAERAATRDYWRVEDEDGRRFWLYRSGDGEDAETGDLRWYMHGIF
jgi:protein ImuB